MEKTVLFPWHKEQTGQNPNPVWRTLRIICSPRDSRVSAGTASAIGLENIRRGRQNHHAVYELNINEMSNTPAVNSNPFLHRMA